ncbi:MAG: hypothetical protein IAE97_14380 [Chthoniobacterales bacterium]|nr:hypothetical protein [Chthoniobacterales bacterium]
MTVAVTEADREFVRRWQTAGPALDAVKWAELQAMDEAEGCRQSAIVMDMADRWLRQNPEITRPSGLVEQQRIFARWWNSRT